MNQRLQAPLNELQDSENFARRHIGPSAVDEAHMLASIGQPSVQALMNAIVPGNILRQTPMDLPAPLSEQEALQELKTIASRNRILKSFIGQGYYGTHTPGVIQRNILENPAWYTAYTPYQAEISQGRLEALLNFQTLVCDLTAMPVANASMLDEATSAAEAMALARRCSGNSSAVFLAHPDVHPQTLEVLRTRAEPMGWTVNIPGDHAAFLLALQSPHFGALVQYPSSTGGIHDWHESAERCHAQKALLIAATDLLALTLLTPPGEWGADIVIGSSQRLGMPMGAGGPHAAFMACLDMHKRSLPGRLVGVSVDAQGAPALRLALQTREQHIRREKATSNICTAQVLPAVMASMFAVYHGPDGLRAIAQRTASLTASLAQGLEALGFSLAHNTAFDTVTVHLPDNALNIATRALLAGVNLRKVSDTALGIALDETSTAADVALLLRLFGAAHNLTIDPHAAPRIPARLQRSSAYLTHPVFHSHRSETAMLRYIRSLSDKDLALDRCMIPLGSCTMKLNATSEMLPITWPEFAQIHPFAPADQQQGYAQLDQQLRSWLCAITGYAGVSLQPNAGSQGEYAGLLAIRAWHASRGQAQRTVCLIPSSAHGTNPASAQMCGMQVVVVACDVQGNIDMNDLQAKCEAHSEKLACIMITYPSTHGVFEDSVRPLCELVHQHGGRVYVDGANMNALVGLVAPGAFGGDVSHLNLHKTFCIPHGGGGPGVGPVCVAEDLVPFLPGHATSGQPSPVGAVSAAPYGNASVLPISWMYIRMMGANGLRHATETAILNANYISAQLKDAYPTLYAGPSGFVAHECILDLRALKESSGVTAEDVAKRLIDYGFHAPTLSFPVPGTLMVEPTESEPLQELNRFIDAMLAIREEIRNIEVGLWPRDDNPLKNAPHTAELLLQEPWPHAYTRTQAAAQQQLASKYWPPVARIDNVHGDRNLVCTCPPMETYLS
ncbi:aminomethyl-transferring glycine dehydrogenase [Comamonas sp. NoAH]|uniref:aminomethyl-transferring glycine dehydrogenase n=1 Tax=Comamonas halotolerans TaxID=3041496 RepID=UPI0024E0BA96|nr:aminomethyl-transferring glycine dehydrogenase [Comamonas sp. NoAH]